MSDCCAINKGILHLPEREHSLCAARWWENVLLTNILETLPHAIKKTMKAPGLSVSTITSLEKIERFAAWKRSALLACAISYEKSRQGILLHRSKMGCEHSGP